MPVTPDDLFQAAVDMLKGGATETNWRNSASRAYYAAYHQARNTADRLGWSINATGTEHQKLQKEFKSRGQVSIGNRLTTQHNRRVEADYRIRSRFSRQEASKQLKEVARLIEELKKL